MKKTTLLLGIFLTLLLGCSKKDCNQPNPASPVQGASATFYKLNISDNGINAVTPVNVPFTKLHSLVAAPVTPHHCIGNFTIAPGGPTSLTVASNVISNQGGMHGFITWTGRFGVQMDAACLEVIGNVAICMGVITSVQNDFGLPSVFAVGNTLIYEVIDNGEGSNAPVSQINDALFYWDPALGPLPCGDDFSQLPWSFYDDIVKGGQINVK